MKRIRCKTSQITPIRPGFTFLEFLVAMVVLGIALTGLFPLMVVCSRGVESLELRYSDQGNKNNNWFSPVYRPDYDPASSRAKTTAPGMPFPRPIPGRANSGPSPRFPERSLPLRPRR